MTPQTIDETNLDQFLVESAVEPATGKRKRVYHIPPNTINFELELMREHWAPESTFDSERGRPYYVVILYEK